MQRLLRVAARVGTQGEIPVAAVVLDAQGHCIGWGSNRRHLAHDPLGHAEISALSQAARLLGDWRLNHCTLLVTLEPCPMCAGAIVQARITRLVFGAWDPKAGACGSILDIPSEPRFNHRVQVTGGLCKEESRELLQEFFRTKRGTASNQHRPSKSVP